MHDIAHSLAKIHPIDCVLRRPMIRTQRCDQCCYRNRGAEMLRRAQHDTGAGFISIYPQIRAVFPGVDGAAIALVFREFGVAERVVDVIAE